MFDKSIGPSFAKVYYQRYISDPVSLSTLYSENAVLSHGNVQNGLAGASAHPRDCYGISQISEELEAIKDKRPKTKIAIVHIDSMPTGNAAVTILVGGYILQESGPSRFVQNFILQGSEDNNNYVVVNDCLRIHERDTENIFNSRDQKTLAGAESCVKGQSEVPVKPKSSVTPVDKAVKSEKEAVHQVPVAAPRNSHEIHDSWCDEIEREEEEIRQQQKKDQADLETLDKVMSITSIAEQDKDIEQAQSTEASATGAKVFSYAAAAKRAPSSGANQVQVNVSNVIPTKSQAAEGADSESNKDKKPRRNLKGESAEGSRNPSDRSHDEKTRNNRTKQPRNKPFKKESFKKADGKTNEHVKAKEAGESTVA
ncbi:hypothetical protein XU18_0592 [Perkinsela sp. CCAP 1560/4]|nr:hypothetical protein XU18_1193 [Perkinsela sp. CCAP 1560/4]KNH09172.1 hypothetical protein XU18_0592 [Perkinsela sp. CCAP 1560/4]|eukprot:KNH08185.1 hypothetical protein XU18_1193 [Perkinsela sp. CCAP 1560/4]